MKSVLTILSLVSAFTVQAQTSSWKHEMSCELMIEKRVAKMQVYSAVQKCNDRKMTVEAYGSIKNSSSSQVRIVEGKMDLNNAGGKQFDLSAKSDADTIQVSFYVPMMDFGSELSGTFTRMTSDQTMTSSIKLDCQMMEATEICEP